MMKLRKLALITAIFLAAAGAFQTARASEPPADLCSLLAPADVSRILGQAFDAPQKSVAPRPFANTNTGTDCNYQSKGGGKLWFRAYVDPSPSAATELFARLKVFYGTPTPVSGLGDEAYFDRDHGLHARKGKVRFFISLSPIGNFDEAKQKQLRDLGSRVAAQL